MFDLRQILRLILLRRSIPDRFLLAVEPDPLNGCKNIERFLPSPKGQGTIATSWTVRKGVPLPPYLFIRLPAWQAWQQGEKDPRWK